MLHETSLSPGIAERLRVRVRPDLVIREQLYEGRTHYVVKDPVGLRYFRFKEEEFYLLQCLDGKRRLEEVKDDYESHFKPHKITVEELARFASQLTQAGIASVDAPRQGQVLYGRFKKLRFRKRLAAFTNILYIKIPVFDPDKLLQWMLPYFRWIYHPITVAATLALWCLALLWVMAHYDELQAKIPEFHTFFNVRNVVYMWLALGAVKIIHEFGHGLTCKYFRGECHEMGVLFLVLSPCLYCDVSDSWLLPNKWHRVWIGAAGIYVELTIAAICTFIWWHSDAGLINNLALSTMFICSVNTVLFNGNPLLRYDGYYMLMDLMEIPNLRAKASRFFSSLFAKVCLGLPADIEPYLPKSRRTFFFLFAVASYVYRWFVSFAILWFLYRFLVPYKLGTLSAMMAGASLGTLLVVPGYQLGKFLWESRRTSKVSKIRLSITGAVFAVAAGLFFFLKLPYNVKASFVTAPRDPEYAFVEVSGILRQQFVKDGDVVKKGDKLAVLENLEKQERLLDTEQMVYQHLETARALRFAIDPRQRLEVRPQEELAFTFQQQVDSLKQELERLTLVAASDGTVMQPPLPEKLGTYLESGPNPFCQIGDPAQLEAWLVIDQGYNEYVKEGQKVELKFYGHPLRNFDGEITAIPNVDVAHLPPELSNAAGGEIATRPDPKTGQQVPVHTLYYAVVPLDNPKLILQPGLRGKAKIKAEPLPLAIRVWRWVKNTFHFEA
jgi:putative peptide zinc metalloprotease protein